MLFFTKIKYGTRFGRMSYSRVETRLLGSGFETNFFDYDLDHKFPNYNMRSDCITSCLRRNYSCPADKFVFQQYLLREEYVAHKGNTKMNLCNSSISTKYLNLLRTEYQCLQECRKDCKFTHFITNNEFDDKQATSYTVHLIVSHNNLPDILIKHLPEITFNAFVCNFGGLLGLWLGLSVFAIFTEFRDICIKLFRNLNFCSNLYQFNIFNQITKYNMSRQKLFKKSKTLESIRIRN